MSEEAFKRLPQKLSGDARKHPDFVSGWEDAFGIESNEAMTLWRIESTLKKCGVSIEPSDKVLEIGTGQGALLKAMHEAGWDAVGIDARPRGNTEGVAAARIEQLPYADGTFKAIIAKSVFDPVVYNQDENLMLAEISRVLKPGGVLYCAIHGVSPYDAERAGLHLLTPRKDLNWEAVWRKDIVTKSLPA